MSPHKLRFSGPIHLSPLFAGLTLPSRSAFLSEIKPYKAKTKAQPGQDEEILVNSIIASEILVNLLKSRLEYNLVVNQWFVYGGRPGVWVPVADAVILSQIKLLFSHLDILSITRGISYLINVKEALQIDHRILRDSAPVNRSISCWIKDELLPGEGCFVGGASDVQKARSSFLYPVYHQFCKRNSFQPVSVRVFSQHLISTIAEHFPSFCDVKSIRRNSGTFIVGVQINPRVYSGDYHKSGLLELGNSEIVQSDLPELEVSQKGNK
jgi:hypothetical protein